MWNDLFYLFLQAYEQFSSLPLSIEIALLFIFIAVVITLTSYCSILFRRYNAYVYRKRLAYITPIIEDMITEQVLLNENLGKGLPVEDIEFDQVAITDKIYKTPGVRQVVIDIIIRYRKNFRGEIGDLLRKLYIDMHLVEDSFKKLRRHTWEMKIKAITELQQMDISIADSTLLPLTNSNIQTLRAVSRNAYIQLSKNDPFKFFDIATEPILPWDQLDLFKIITTSKELSIPSFSRWVSYSTNKSVVSFCLKLIVYYDQQNAIPAVMELLNTKDHFFRANAINCLGKLSSEIPEETLVKIYGTQPLNCQVQILKALGRIGSGNYLEFLKQEFLNAKDFDIQINSARSIIRHNTHQSRLMIQELMLISTEEQQLIIKHCQNPLIKY